MLVNFKHKLIYVKTWKTGGTTVEGRLEEALWGSQSQHWQDWQIRLDGFVTPRPQGRLSPRQRAFVLCSPYYPVRLKYNIGNLRNHSSPDQIRDSIGEEIWSSFMKVACIRNPFSLMVSGHFFKASLKGLRRNDVDNEKAFAAFVRKRMSIEEKTWQENLPDLADSSWRFIRQEHLEDDFRHLASNLDLEPVT
jgi:hypothetical protein